MGYWSVLASVDYMDDHCNYELPMSVDQAIAAIEQAVARPGRVECQRILDGQHLQVLTVKHTPAWTLFNIFVLFLRKTCRAEIVVHESQHGAAVTVRGKLDTRAASSLRALATQSGRTALSVS